MERERAQLGREHHRRKLHVRLIYIHFTRPAVRIGRERKVRNECFPIFRLRGSYRLVFSSVEYVQHSAGNMLCQPGSMASKASPCSHASTVAAIETTG